MFKRHLVSKLTLIFSVILCSTEFPSQAATLPKYKIQHIDGLEYFDALRISDAGHIVTGRQIWFAGTIQDLGGLDTYAMDVNASGQVVGRVYDGTTPFSNAFIWQNGVMSYLPNLSGEEGFATAINNNGQIIGYSDNILGESDENFRATLWNTPSVATDIGVIGSDRTSLGFAINNTGQVGASSAPKLGAGFGWDAFLWNAGQTTTFINDSDPSFTVEGINDSTEVVGTYLSGAYVWSGGQLKLLPSLGGDFTTASGINNAHQIVGRSIDSEGNMHAVTWINSELYDLESLVSDLSGWDYLSMATDINESGQIVGLGKLKDGPDNQVFLLTPPSTAPVIKHVEADHSVLWPPNNKKILVSLTATIQGGSGNSTWKIIKVESNESTRAGDIQIVENHSVRLAASRSGKGNGRIYTIWVQAQNESGNLSKAVSLQVLVPHDKR